MALLMGVPWVWLCDPVWRSVADCANRRIFALAVWPSMCRTRAEEHVTSMNSAIFTSQKAAEN
jgi:hypothetical protein